jgi:hypothetical protein
MAQSHEPPAVESMRGLAAGAGVALDFGRSGCLCESQSYELSTEIVGAIYDPSERSLSIARRRWK